MPQPCARHALNAEHGGSGACQCRAQSTALRQAVLIRRLVYGKRLAACCGTAGSQAVCPIAHPLPVAPTVRAEQRHLFAGKAALQLGKKRFKFTFFQHLGAHGRAA